VPALLLLAACWWQQHAEGPLLAAAAAAVLVQLLAVRHQQHKQQVIPHLLPSHQHLLCLQDTLTLPQLLRALHSPLAHPAAARHVVLLLLLFVLLLCLHVRLQLLRLLHPAGQASLQSTLQNDKQQRRTIHRAADEQGQVGWHMLALAGFCT
jgi:hypothetical protein